MKIERPKSKQPIPENAKKVFTGQLFDVYQWEQEMFDGSKKIFEKIKRPDTVVIFPVISPEEILLTQQVQPGRDEFIDAAGGRVDEGEDVLEAAKRELLEETGYEADEFVLWKAEHPTAKIEWVVYNFIAKGCKKATEQHVDSGEKIKFKKVNFDEFLKLATDTRFRAKEIVPDLLEAQISKEKYEELKNLFSLN